MDATPSGTPIPFDPSFEHIAADEAETIHQLQEAMLKVSHTTFADTGHGLRSVHAKCHGLLRGEMRVLDGLPPEWAQGIFKRPRTYPVVMRLSTSPGDLIADSVSLPRGIAIKVLGVEGERLPGSEADTTQDFLMIDGPSFVAPDARHFLNSVKLLAATTDKAEGLKKGLSAVLRGVERALESQSIESATLKGLGGHPMTHILGESFFTQVPLRHGRYMGKLSLVPVSPRLTALTGAPVDLAKRPDGLRESVRDYFRDHAAEWELRVQLCTDLETMPIEDASVAWPQAQSAYVAVARITAPRQVSWDGARSMAMDDRLCFSPWHGVVDHQPLGSIMRARRQVYQASAQFRGSRNGCPMHQPRSVEEAVELP